MSEPKRQLKRFLVYRSTTLHGVGTPDVDYGALTMQWEQNHITDDIAYSALPANIDFSQVVIAHSKEEAIDYVQGQEYDDAITRKEGI